MRIDADFDYWAEINPGLSVWEARNSRDPDGQSRRLQSAHKFLWSKALPNGQFMELECIARNQLQWGKFRLGSDSITNSYISNIRIRAIVEKSKSHAAEMFRAGCRIGAFILFPSYRVDRQNTINGARGMNLKIADRIDLTLESIRRHYQGGESPLSTVLMRYANFFNLFMTFDEYVDFWLLNDIVDDKYNVQFYLPFDDFERNGAPNSVQEYQQMSESTIQFLRARTSRVATHASNG